MGHRRGCVLLVEDEDGVRRIARRSLERAGYRVFEARDGVSALALGMELRHLDALVADLVLPGGCTGPEVLRRLRVRHPTLPCVLISGWGPERLARMGGECTDCLFLAKPFVPAQLTDSVAFALAWHAEGVTAEHPV